LREPLEGWQNGYCTSLENWRAQALGGSSPSPSVTRLTSSSFSLLSTDLSTAEDLLDLEDFVATSLEQIVKGVKRAQDAVLETGAKINSKVNKLTELRDHQTGISMQYVEFDLAVTASDSTKTGGGLKAGVAVLSANFGGGSDSQHSSVTRIKFTVPLVLPKWKNETDV
jgi:hypothetical protein